jgi:hypothetical protein
MVEHAFRILSDEATVISGQIRCWHCQAYVVVICLYCQSGFVEGEAMLDFSVSNISDVDESLRVQLARWPQFHPTRLRGGDIGPFANHCPSCGRPQEDFYLHCEPGGVFFRFQDPMSQELQIHALQGIVSLSGDEGIEP